MEAEVVRYLLKKEKGKRAVLARLVLYCAPFLKRLKISAMIWMPEELLEELETLMDEGEISAGGGDFSWLLF